MIPVKKAEIKKSDSSFEKTHTDNKANTVPQSFETPLETIAKFLAILELKDSHSLQKEFLKNPETSSELKKISETKESVFLGIIGKCMLPDCDVHALDQDLNIISHFKETEAVAEHFIHAREIARDMPQTVIAILVFNDHLTYLHLNGKVEKCA